MPEKFDLDTFNIALAIADALLVGAIIILIVSFKKMNKEYENF